MPLPKNLIERVFAHCRRPEVLEEVAMPGGLVKFYITHEPMLMAHGH